MHLNYHFFKKLIPDLKNKLSDAVLIEAFSQNKDELILGFLTGENSDFYIKINTSPEFAIFNFPKEYARARRNSVNLFEEIQNLRIKNILLFENERAFEFEFENQFKLVFKFFGKRSNVVLFQNDQVKNLFNHHLKEDFNLKIEELNVKDNSEPPKTWGKLPKALLKEGLSIEDINKQLEDDNYYIIKFENEIHFSLVKIGEVLFQYNNYEEALIQFEKSYYTITLFEKEQKKLIHTLKKSIEKSESYILNQQNRKQALKKGPTQEEIGHIIMANIQNIPEQAKEVELLNFYTNEPIKIKLKDSLNAQKNAENYYRKGKNEKKELENIENTIQSKEQEIENFKFQLSEIENAQSLKEINKYLKVELNKEKETLPFKIFNFNEFQILVGRNSKNNDILTFKYATKNDLWLHARDSPGSHVIIKNHGNQVFPKDVLERGAQIAAWFSKRRNENLVPVIYTEKKYVRKLKGADPGKVILDKEELIMVRPEKFE